MECYYCRENEALDKEIINPSISDIHPTCAVCEYDFKLLKSDTDRLKPLYYLGTALLVMGVLAFFYEWKTAVAMLLAGIIMKLIASSIVASHEDKRDDLAQKFAKDNGWKR